MLAEHLHHTSIDCYLGSVRVFRLVFGDPCLLVAGFLNGGDWTLVEEVLEVESAKRNDRPALPTALKLCPKHLATLVIAKLDRLARNGAFISNLMGPWMKRSRYARPV